MGSSSGWLIRVVRHVMACMFTQTELLGPTIDIYREAAKSGLKVERVEVEVEGEFGANGEPAKNVSYRAKVTAQASEAQIRELMSRTDRVAEFQNALRRETPEILGGSEILEMAMQILDTIEKSHG